MGSLRGPALTLTFVLFGLVMVTFPPTLTIVEESRSASKQLAQWKHLADKVNVLLPSGTGDTGFEQIKHRIGSVVHDAERRDGAALSYTWARGGAASPPLDQDDSFSLVTAPWLAMMVGRADWESAPGFTKVAPEKVPIAVTQMLEPNLEIWRRHTDRPLKATDLAFYRYTGRPGLPLAEAGSGVLLFSDQALIAVAPSLYETFDDGFLGSVSSTGNIVLTGLSATRQGVQDHGLSGKVTVKYVAEAGVLRAQYAEYFAWLQGISLVTTVVALVLSAGVSASVRALVRARRDFPLRFSGATWAEVVGERLPAELVVMTVITVLAVFTVGGAHRAEIVLLGVLMVLLTPVMHVLAVRKVFDRVATRRI
ncbi:hypothetical protein [Austwickia chelonae]|uniref:hypothetical protein n=1 Tax=Austwickia chelonae TaxID=100225 RepID=UPI000E239FBA|nr:hypothetical protein [Austwickia chelonae]